MTFSLVARCEATGMFGVAIASSSPAVAARCSHARAGIGAVATQNITNPAIGALALKLMEGCAKASNALFEIKRLEKYIEYRQVLIVDRSGESAIHTGKHGLGRTASAQAAHIAAAGNLLANDAVPNAMVAGYLAAEGPFGARLLAGLRAGLDEGGEEGPVHSAGLKVVDEVPWPIVDLRSDWNDDCPVTELERLWAIYYPQMNDYIKRANNPEDAPSFGVPGDQ
ncbi:MAG: DUF1028 domain-containing protein [Pseudomonadota bacterium]